MRNPFKRYYFLSMLRNSPEQITLVNINFTTYFWRDPRKAYYEAIETLAEFIECDIEELELVSFTKV